MAHAARLSSFFSFVGILFLAYSLRSSTCSAEEVVMTIMDLSQRVRDLQQRQERSNLELTRDLGELLGSLTMIKEVNDDRSSFFHRLLTDFSQQKENLRTKLKEASSSVSRILHALQRLQRRHVSQDRDGHYAGRSGEKIYDIQPYFQGVQDKVAELAADVQGLMYDLKTKSVVNKNCFKKSGRPGPTSRLVTAWCPPVFRDTGERSCAELLRSGHREDGVYATKLSDNTVPAFCDMSTDGGGWNVLLRSHSSAITSSESASGVDHLWNPTGDLSLDFWWGWKNVLLLTHSQVVELNVILRHRAHDNQTEQFPSTNQTFTIKREGNMYILASVVDDADDINTIIRVMKLTGESAQVYNEDGSKIMECRAAVVRRVYLAEEVLSLDLTCLGALFTGKEIEHSGIVVMARPIMSTA